jgi:hypothetical protein
MYLQYISLLFKSKHAHENCSCLKNGLMELEYYPKIKSGTFFTNYSPQHHYKSEHVWDLIFKGTLDYRRVMLQTREDRIDSKLLFL